MSEDRTGMNKKSIELGKKFDKIVSEEKFTLPNKGMHKAVILFFGIMIMISAMLFSDLHAYRSEQDRY